MIAEHAGTINAAIYNSPERPPGVSLQPIEAPGHAAFHYNLNLFVTTIFEFDQGGWISQAIDELASDWLDPDAQKISNLDAILLRWQSFVNGDHSFSAYFSWLVQVSGKGESFGSSWFIASCWPDQNFWAIWIWKTIKDVMHHVFLFREAVL